MNWTKISGIYTANGSEEYITIGNFFNDAETDTLFTGFGDYHGAYYYIDDVSVIPIDSLNGMSAYAGEDVLVNPGDSVFIGQEISKLNCTWKNLSTGEILADSDSGIYVHPDETTSYLVEQNLCGAITYDTVKVSVGYAGLQSEKESESESEVKIYPNPSNGELYIYHEGTELGEYQITIFDLTGQLIFSELIPELKKQQKLSLDVASGIYNLQLLNKTSNEKTNFKLYVK